MAKKTFSKEFMIEVLDGVEGQIVSNEISDTSRWSIHYKLVFNYEGKFYQTGYSRGATESQDESPWQYETTVECTEVQPVQKLVTVYEPISDQEQVAA